MHNLQIRSYQVKVGDGGVCCKVLQVGLIKRWYQSSVPEAHLDAHSKKTKKGEHSRIITIPIAVISHLLQRDSELEELGQRLGEGR